MGLGERGTENLNNRGDIMEKEWEKSWKEYFRKGIEAERRGKLSNRGNAERQLRCCARWRDREHGYWYARLYGEIIEAKIIEEMKNGKA